MEMNNKIVAETENLRDQTEKLSKEIKYWTWTELLLALKQSQDLLPEPPSPVMLLDKLFDSLIERIASSCETSSSPSISSPNTSEFSLSCDTRSSISLSWWFEDLVALNTNVIEMLVKLMVSRNFDNGIISKFLFHYRKSRLAASPASPDDKVKIIEAVIEMLYSLDIRCVSHKSLFELLRVANVSRCRTSKLESMIGSLLDQANPDHLLIPSPPRKSYMYDVNLVLSFLKSFLGKGVFCVPLSRMKKVGILMDLYLAEIAPDPHLEPAKFSAVIRALPESSRDSFDGVYRAVNLYLEVHSGLCEEEKMRMCVGVKYEKLSREALVDLIGNGNFPSRCVDEALISQRRKLKSLVDDGTDKGGGSNEQINVVYAQKVDDDDDYSEARLKGMQWRALELEKLCHKIQIEMGKLKLIKSRFSRSTSSVTSLPNLCS